MKAKDLLLFAVIGVVGFMAYQKFAAPPAPALPANPSQVPTGGTTTASPPSVFEQVLGIFSNISSVAASVAQTNAKSV